MSAVPAGFYARKTVVVARELLGHFLVSTVGGRRCAVRIVETEAYVGPDDPACHAYRWHRSARNEVMYGRPGLLYVYFTYGMHWCANIVTEREGYPAAVLLRGAEPVEGVELMRRRRHGVRDDEIASGPAKLAQALGITGALNGHFLTHPPLWVDLGEPVRSQRRASSPRVGVRRGAEHRLRFYERGNLCVSRPRAGHSARLIVPGEGVPTAPAPSVPPAPRRTGWRSSAA